MKQVAFGIRMHSGWGVLVAVCGDANSVDVVDRRRIVTMDPGIPGAKQPYHYAASLELPAAERHIAKCAASSECLALAAVQEVAQELRVRKYQIVAAAVLLASGRPLPTLPKILASHPLLHTAEGELFRNAVRNACKQLKVSVTAFPERELETRVKAAVGEAASRVQRKLLALGPSLGPPWTKDHKTAALAAFAILAAYPSRDLR